MPSSYSTNLRFELIATGEQSGTWGTTSNTNIGTLIEQAISGIVTQAITDGADTTLTFSDGATSVPRNMFIEMTGALTATRNMVVPANKKLYFIFNNTTGGFAVTVKVSGQTGVSVANGAKVVLAINSAGTDVVSATTYVITSGALGTPSSGTLSNCTGLPPQGGGTGVANSSGMTVTGSGNFAYTRTLTGTTNVTFPTSGTLINNTQNTSGQAGSVASLVTFNNGGGGGASGSTYNGSGALTVSYNTVGAQVAGSYPTGSGTCSGTNTGDQTNISGTASNITAFTINQSVGTGNSPSFVDVTITSDESLKTNWRPFKKSMLERLAQVKRGIYRRTDTHRLQAGVSANDMEHVIKECVTYDANGKRQISQSATLAILAELTAEVLRLRGLVEAK